VKELSPKLGTGNKARLALGQGLIDLNIAYQHVAEYNPTGVPTTGLFSDDVTAQGVDYLDGIRARAESDFALLPATDDPITLKLSNQVAFDIASIETASRVTNTLGTAMGDLSSTINDGVLSLKKKVLYVGIGLGILLALVIIAKRGK